MHIKLCNPQTMEKPHYHQQPQKEEKQLQKMQSSNKEIQKCKFWCLNSFLMNNYDN